MNCFNHPNVPAVGICKACQKGLCKECAVDLGHGIACKGHHEEVDMLNSFQFYKLAPLIFTMLGIILVLGGATMDIMDKDGSILRFMGIGMLVLSMFFLTLRNILRKPQNKQAKESINQ